MSWKFWERRKKEAIRRPVKYVVTEDEDVSFFGTKYGVESTLEAIDVNNGIFVGYDSEGYRLIFRAEEDPSRGFEIVKIDVDEAGGRHEEELKSILSSWLACVGKDVESRDLASLLSACEDSVEDGWVRPEAVTEAG